MIGFDEQSNKLVKVLEGLSEEELKDFVFYYAYSHESFKLSLYEKFWKPEEQNVKEVVEACFVHPSILGKSIGRPELDWELIEKDLEVVIDKAISRKEDSPIDAALISGYVLTMTCHKFEEDHRGYRPIDYDAWLAQNKGLMDIVSTANDMVKELLIHGTDIEEDSKLGMLKEIADELGHLESRFLVRWDETMDAAMPLLVSEKEYMAYINANIKKDKLFAYKYINQKADYYAFHDNRVKAEKVFEKDIDTYEVMEHYAEWLMKWGDFEKAYHLACTNDDMMRWAQCDRLALDILKKSENEKWMEMECRKHFLESKYRMKWYQALKDLVPESDWRQYLIELLDECTFKDDLEDAEAKIYIAEGITDRMMNFFDRKSWDLLGVFSKYGKYLTSEELSLVTDRICQHIKDIIPSTPLRRREYRHYSELIEMVCGVSHESDMKIMALIEELISNMGNRCIISDF